MITKRRWVSALMLVIGLLLGWPGQLVTAAPPRSFGFVPKHERVASRLGSLERPTAAGPRRFASETQLGASETEPSLPPSAVHVPPEVVADGAPPTVYEEVHDQLGYPDEFVHGDCADCGGCGSRGGFGNGCGSCPRCLIPCPIVSIDNLELSAGVHGFTGPVNRGDTGSFGFHYGLNYGAPLPCLPWGLGGQLGVNVAHSNLSGATFTRDERTQWFATGGLFRRVDWGLQGGLVIDFMSDDWYRNSDLVQVRGETSWVFSNQHELGVWYTTGTRESTTLSFLSEFSGLFQVQDESFEARDLVAFFYRKQLNPCGAEARVFVGFSGDSDAVVGGNVRLPLAERLLLEGGFTYLAPEAGSASGGHLNESWNLTMGVVWYPGRRTARNRDYYRPLFNVADNGTFLVKRR